MWVGGLAQSNSYGFQFLIVPGVRRKPSSGCCVWRGALFRDGEEWGPWHARKYCVRGDILSSRFVWPFGANTNTLPGNKQILIL